MSELAVQYDDEPVEAQVEETTEEVTEEVAEESTETEAVDEPKEEPKDEPISFSEAQQQFINERIVGKKVAQMREIERQNQELQEKLAKFDQPQADPEGAPVIPELPDVWDANYEDRLRERDDAIVAKARWESEQSIVQQQQERQQYEAQLKAQQELHTKVISYTERAKSLGIAEGELQVAGNAVSQMGMPDDLVNYILAEDQGPAITMYLAKNLQEIQTLQGMNPMQAAVYIASEIKPKVSRNLKRKAAPEPTESIKGSGLPENKRGPKGATFE